MRYSIIIPMYNVEGYIARCLDSIYSQNFNDCEVILVDDGSTDNTIKEAENAVNTAGKELLTKIIKKQNTGASDTRNVGLEASTGDYIIFMDADDRMTSNALFEMNKTVSESVADLYVFSLIKEIDGKLERSNLTDIEGFTIVSKNSTDCLEQYLNKTQYLITWQPWSKVFRKSIIEENKIMFDSRLYCCNDFNFFMQYFLCINSVIFNPVPTTIYSFARPGSISWTKLEKRFMSSATAYSDMFVRIKEKSPSAQTLLKYMSYLFLCCFDLAVQLSGNDETIMKNVVENNSEIYNYADDKISRLRRLCFKLLGFKKGALAVREIRNCTKYFRSRNSDI